MALVVLVELLRRGWYLGGRYVWLWFFGNGDDTA